MSVNDIPLELRASSRWMAWCNIDGNKIPLNAKTGKGHRGYHEDPNAWSSFQQAMKRARVLSSKRGVGLLVGTPFVAVDIDHCVEDDKLDARATNIIAKLPSTYCEFSPSGTGLHLWYRCKDHDKLPPQAKVVFEAYARRRFMTVTGNPVVNTPIRELSLAEALEVFRLADPFSNSEEKPLSDEEGYWCPQALDALLKAWKERLPNFRYESMGGKWSIPCPWHERHTTNTANILSRDAQVWVNEKSWAVFHCLHAHCAGRTWRHFVEHYDPFEIYFNFDAWQEAELEKLV